MFLMKVFRHLSLIIKCTCQWMAYAMSFSQRLTMPTWQEWLRSVRFVFKHFVMFLANWHRCLIVVGCIHKWCVEIAVTFRSVKIAVSFRSVEIAVTFRLWHEFLKCFSLGHRLEWTVCCWIVECVNIKSFRCFLFLRCQHCIYLISVKCLLLF